MFVNLVVLSASKVCSLRNLAIISTFSAQSTPLLYLVLKSATEILEIYIHTGEPYELVAPPAEFQTAAVQSVESYLNSS